MLHSQAQHSTLVGRQLTRLILVRTEDGTNLKEMQRVICVARPVAAAQQLPTAARQADVLLAHQSALHQQAVSVLQVSLLPLPSKTGSLCARQVARIERSLTNSSSPPQVCVRPHCIEQSVFIQSFHCV